MKPSCERMRIVRFAAIFVMSVLFLPVGSFSQSTSDVEPVPDPEQIMVAPVRVDREIIFWVRGISSYPARQRAETIVSRIVAAARDRAVLPDSVRVLPEADRIRIFAGERFIMNVYEVDAEREGIKISVLAELYRNKIGVTIEKYRYDRSRPVLLKDSMYALGAVILMAVLLFVLRRVFRWLNTALQNKIRSRVESMESKSFHLIQSGQLWKTFHILFRIIKITVLVMITAVFLHFILSLFPWTNTVTDYALRLILDPVKTLGIGILNFIPKLAFLIVIYLATRYLLKLVRLLFAGIQAGEITIGTFKSEWAMPTYRIIRLLIIAFAVIIAYPYIPGSDSNAFKGVSVFLGILLSLGSSSFIGNLIAGYSMTYRGAFKAGDRIQVDGHVGIVLEQKLLVTRLRSLKNEEIVIPNSVLLNSNIINYSTRVLEGGLILHTTVGIGYETPWRQVEAMLKLAAARTEGLLKDPPPFVLQHSLGDFAITYELNVHCNDVARIPYYYTVLHQNILDVFNENNIQIMTPAYERDPETPKVVPAGQWEVPLAKET